MSSDDGNDYHKNHHHHQTQQSVTPTPSTTSNLSASSSNTLRRKSLTQSHFPHQLQTQAININCSIGGSGVLSVAKDRDRIDIIERNCSDVGTITGTASPIRFIQQDDLPAGYHTIATTRVPPERYEEPMTCCLPPPSPAPTSDRFVIGIPSPSGNPYSDHHRFSIHQQRTMSPNSRYRSSMPPNERGYRDMSPKCDRFVTPGHFLANSTPLASTENYAYLNSIVHTPVKRYIPTPPPPVTNDSYAESGYHTTGRTHVSNNIPYRLRLKCCSNDNAPTSLPIQQTNVSSTNPGMLNLVHDPTNGADHYATPPRVRPIKCSSNSNSNNPNLMNNSSQIPSNISSSSSRSSRCGLEAPIDYPSINRTPSSEYIGPNSTSSGRVGTPVNILSEQNSISCLHCNTMRRATGVHQTTQTGPISPVPVTPIQPQDILHASSASSSSSASSTTIAGASIPPPSPIPSPSSISIVNAQQSQQQNQPLPPLPIQPPPSSPVQSLHLIQSQETSPRSHRKEPNLNYSSSVATSTNLSTNSLTIQQNTRSISNNNNNNHSMSTYDQVQNQMAMPNAVGMQSRPSPQQQQQQLLLHQQQFQQQQQSHHHHLQQQQQQQQQQQLQQQQQQLTQQNRHQQTIRLTRKQKIKEYIRRQFTQFFGIDEQSEELERYKWAERQKRFAIRQFGPLRHIPEPNATNLNNNQNGDRPDILPAQVNDDLNNLHRIQMDQVIIPKKLSVPKMMWNGMSYIVKTLSKKGGRKTRQWSRSFAPSHISPNDETNDICDGLSPLQDDEVFFDSPNNTPSNRQQNNPNNSQQANQMIETRQIYMGERVNGWRTRSTELQILGQGNGYRGTRISSQLIDGVLDNSRRSIQHNVKLLKANELDDRNDYRPFFTYWINTVQILVLILSIICYGIGPIGIGMEQKTSQVLVTSLSLQQVQHMEQRNLWIGLRSGDLVHLGAKFATCMRRDSRTLDVVTKTRRNERETACCIRNDDSGCVQSSQADCSVRGLWPTSISTWKKWSPGDSGPGGRISGSVCGLDPKYCDAPASIAPYEWPDDITKWPICRKTNSFSQRFRFKDHTAEHMVCEVIGHPCCIGIHGECRITTREYCDFVHGYFHEEASLCSQVSCLNDVCGMFPFLSPDFPDQFYRLFTSLCLHAGVVHLAITVAFQHILLADLERLLGPIRTAIVYIGSGIAGNLTSAIFVPYKPEVGPLASLAGVVSSLTVLLILIHWKQLKKTHVAFLKLITIGGVLFGIGTLPWQQNFTGLIGGITFGIGLTLALVPFVSITKYDRKSKINLIWTCMLLHLAIYTAMFILFYVFPSAVPSLNLYDINDSGYTEIGGGVHHNNNNNNDGIITCDNKGSCPNDAHIHA